MGRFQSSVDRPELETRPFALRGAACHLAASSRAAATPTTRSRLFALNNAMPIGHPWWVGFAWPVSYALSRTLAHQQRCLRAVAPVHHGALTWELPCLTLMAPLARTNAAGAVTLDYGVFSNALWVVERRPRWLSLDIAVCGVGLLKIGDALRLGPVHVGAFKYLDLIRAVTFETAELS